MRNALTLCLVLVSASSMAQTAEPAPSSSAQSRGLLSRLRGDRPSTRQQLQNSSVDVAQPATAQQGYQPGVTFPQQQQQVQQPAYPAYPPAAPPGFYPPPQQPQQARPTQTPSSAQRSSSDSDESKSNQSSRSSSGRSGSSSSQSGSRSGSSSTSSNETSKKSSSSRSSDSSADSKSSSEAKKESSTPTDSDAGSKSSSALEKIVKKVESGKSEEKAEAEKAEEKKPSKTKEEIEIEKAREAAAKAADKATTVVASFLQQSNDGYYSKAADHLAPAIQKYFQSEISAVNGTLKAVLDELTGNGTITMVTYVNRIVRGEGAQVEAELAYEGGRTVRRTFDLVEIENDWKIVLPVTADGRAAAVSTASAAPQTAPAATPAAAPAPTEAAPPTPEQAAAQAPLVLAPGYVAPDASTTAPQ